MNAVVVLPPGYTSGSTRYPVVYYIHGFRSGAAGAAFSRSGMGAAQLLNGMRQGTLPKMIYVYPDAQSQLGHTEFADSANNGPWGTAFVSDLVPYVTKTYRVQPGAQFLTGHSSGAWSALWLQLRYTSTFAGTWAVSPDPLDFRDFLSVDIYRRGANMYRNDGRDVPYERIGQRTVLTMRQAAALESVEGRTGGQIASFEAVFGPRMASGEPGQLFDRRTGRISAVVANAWRRYDISEILARHWSTLSPIWKSKVHIYVGDKDNYFLDGPARLMAARLRAQQLVTIVPGADHFNIYKNGLAQTIAAQMQIAASRVQHVAATP